MLIAATHMSVSKREITMLRTTALATVLIGAVTAAHAAGPVSQPVEPIVQQPAPMQSPFWAGGYVGGQLGYAYGDFDLGNVDPRDFDNDSVIGGFHAGYLWEVSPGFYLGPEFQYDFADVTVTDPDTGGTASFDEIARLKLIAGYELGNGLLFGSAGIAYADFDGSVGGIFDGIDGGETSYVVGIGYDHRVSDNWTVGGEYQFHRFNNLGAGGEDVDVNTLHLRASYRF
jgi:outer membrane immunogenic protein